MKGTWSLLNNTFEVNTRKSMVKMLQLASDHSNSLLAHATEDPLFAMMAERFMQPLQDFRNEFAQYHGHDANRSSKTQTFTGLLRKLSKEWLPEWEGKVFYYYPENSPNATMIFPHKRSAFQRGSYEEIVFNVMTLHEMLKHFPLLADMRQDVLEKYELLLTARSNQIGQKATVASHRILLENQRIRLAVLMLRNLGLLLDKYGETPSSVERFFDLKLLRRNMPDHSVLYKNSGQVGAGATVIVPLPATLTLSLSSYCRLSNASDKQAMEFYFTTGDPESVNMVRTTVPADETLEVNASECGWATGKKFLAVKNTGSRAAAFSFLLMKEWVLNKAGSRKAAPAADDPADVEMQL